jgi:hypothetical protein
MKFFTPYCTSEDNVLPPSLSSSRHQSWRPFQLHQWFQYKVNYKTPSPFRRSFHCCNIHSPSATAIFIGWSHGVAIPYHIIWRPFLWCISPTLCGIHSLVRCGAFCDTRPRGALSPGIWQRGACPCRAPNGAHLCGAYLCWAPCSIVPWLLLRLFSSASLLSSSLVLLPMLLSKRSCLLIIGMLIRERTMQVKIHCLELREFRGGRAMVSSN